MKIEYDGRVYELGELAKVAGVSRQCLAKRYESGKRGDELVCPLKIKKIRYGEQYLTVAQLASTLGIPKITIYKRISRGFTDEEIINGKRNKKKD